MSAAPNVLVVEDDGDIRSSITDLLTDAGIGVLAAENGSEALRILKSGQIANLILLDLMMPVMDGFQFRELQLQDPELADIPVVVMSADGHVIEKQTRASAVAYLRKPIDIAELLSLVRKLAH